MRTAITVAYLHGGGTKILATPDVPIDEQKQQFKAGRGTGEDPDFERVELWTSSGGVTAKVRFQKPKHAKAPAKQQPEKPLGDERKK